MTAAVVATQLTTPDLTRAYTVEVGPGTDITGSVLIGSLVMEDQGTSVQATTSFSVTGNLVDFPQLRGQALVTIYDHVSNSYAFRGFVDSHEPTRIPTYGQTEVIASDHTSLLDNVIPLESRPAGESDAARIGYLWGVYAGSFLNASLAFVQTVQASMPAQVFAGITLRQALDLIAAQSGDTSTVWYLDRSGRLHYFASESNAAPYNVTSDTPGGGEVAAQDSLRIDWDSKGYTSGVYVRGKTDDGSGWVYSESAKLNHKGLIRTTFMDAPDCTSAAMKTAMGNMYLGRLNSAKARGSFTSYSPNDGWRAGQNVTVRSTHLGNVNAAYRIARVRTSIVGTGSQRKYDVEFGNARAGSYSDPGFSTVMGSAVVGDLVDDNGALLLSSSPNSMTGGLGPALRRYVTSGLYNSDFALAPVGAPDATIVNTWNPLPFWSFTQSSGTAITATSTQDSTTGSGRVIRFRMEPGAASDKSYIEQIAPINSSTNRAYSVSPYAYVEVPETNADCEIVIEMSWLKADGATATGSTYDRTYPSSGFSGNAGEIGLGESDITAPPADAYFAKVRYIVQRRAAGSNTATATVDLVETMLLVAQPRTTIAEVATPATYSRGTIMQSNGFLSIGPHALGVTGATFSPAIGIGVTDAALTQQGYFSIGHAGLRTGGTAFPTAPATDELYFRTDLGDGTWCTWDGTRWVGPEEAYTYAVSGVTASGSTDWEAGPFSDADVRIVGFHAQSLVLTTNSATDYWTVVLADVDTGGAITTDHGSYSTAADGTTLYVGHWTANSDVVTYTTRRGLLIRYVKTLAPGALYVKATVRFRRIYT